VIIPPEVTPPALLEADFENGLSGWSTAGAGDAIPKVTTDIVREGDKASAVRLSGEQDRSELILGGNGSGSTAGTIRFLEGDEYFYGFSFYIETMVYGEPGAHNLIMQFKSNDGGSPNFGLQLWDYAGDDGHSGGRGLWSHGPAMGGDRFLAPVAERTWHDVVIHFKASSVGAGFYEVYLDGAQVDARSGVSMIVPGAAYAYIKDGLYRNGEEIPGVSEIRLDAAKLGDTMESVLP
jgi:Polysaccharide lyase